MTGTLPGQSSMMTKREVLKDCLQSATKLMTRMTMDAEAYLCKFERDEVNEVRTMLRLEMKPRR
jgi:thioredoxin reductase